MVQKIHPRIWVPSIQPLAGHLPEENDDLAVQYEDVRALSYSQVPNKRAAPFIVFFLPSCSHFFMIPLRPPRLFNLAQT